MPGSGTFVEIEIVGVVVPWFGLVGWIVPPVGFGWVVTLVGVGGFVGWTLPPRVKSERNSTLYPVLATKNYDFVFSHFI